MPTKEAHVAVAKSNQRTIDYLLQTDDHLGWVVTVAFYKALHIVEAMLHADQSAPRKHTDDHKTRNKMLKTTNRYKHIWASYGPLHNLSLVARYLQEDPNGAVHSDFSVYMPRAAVESMALSHYLAQIEKSACKCMGDDKAFA